MKTSTRYVASGDLNGDGIIDSNDEWEYSAAIDYTTDNITAPIENKGCLMLFDEILDVDMDEMIYAYYGGMLGKATKHLPLVGHYTLYIQWRGLCVRYVFYMDIEFRQLSYGTGCKRPVG